MVKDKDIHGAMFRVCDEHMILHALGNVHVAMHTLAALHNIHVMMSIQTGERGEWAHVVRLR